VTELSLSEDSRTDLSFFNEDLRLRGDLFDLRALLTLSVSTKLKLIDLLALLFLLLPLFGEAPFSFICDFKVNI